MRVADRIPWIVLLAPALLLGACGDDPAPGRVSPEPEAMAVVASDLALVAGVALQQYTAAGMIVPWPQRPASAGAPAAIDTLLRGVLDCPVVRHHTNVSPSYYEFRYAAGCPSDFDGLETAGALEFTVDTESPFAAYDLRSDFVDFVRDGRSVSGYLEVTGSPLVPLVLEATGLDVSGRAAPAFVSVEFELAPAADPCDGQSPICEAWQVTRIHTGAVGTSLFLYNVILQDTLVVSGCHPHFTRGVIAVTSAGTYPAIIDFGDGTCDDTATMTVEGRTETLTLGYGS